MIFGRSLSSAPPPPVATSSWWIGAPAHGFFCQCCSAWRHHMRGTSAERLVPDLSGVLLEEALAADDERRRVRARRRRAS